MMRTFRTFSVVALALLLFGCGTGTHQQVSDSSTFVIVHGAWGGGWAFRQVDDILTAQGHKVYRPTLTGQGERVHLANLEVGLETHIQDVVNTILFEELQDVVLIGHSYGGVVVTGVADRYPQRIRHLIYLDAIVPKDGESVVNSLSRGDRKPQWLKKAKDGFLKPDWVKTDQPVPKDVPHPIKTFTDTIVLKNQDRLQIPTSYILTVESGTEAQKDSFFPFADRARKLGWPVHQMQADHNPQWSAPHELVAFLKKALKLHPNTALKH